MTVPLTNKVSNTVKVQKRMKSIARILHLSSVVQSEFNKVTRILFVRKQNKNTFFSTIHLSGSSVSASTQGCVFYVYLRFDLNENSASLR